MGTKKINNTRRAFFKTSAALVGALAVSSVLDPLKAIVITIEEPKNEGPWWGIGIDIKKCIGCGLCAKACKAENHVPVQPFYFRNWVEQYTILNDGTVKVVSPNGGIDGFKTNEPKEDIFKTFFVPKMCNHCAKSPCTQVCPVGATYISPDGVVLIDDKYCIRSEER